MIRTKNILLYCLFLLSFACTKKQNQENQQNNSQSPDAQEIASPFAGTEQYWDGIWELEGEPNKKMIIGTGTPTNPDGNYAVFFDGTTHGGYTEYNLSTNQIHFSVKSNLDSDMEISKFSWQVEKVNPTATQIIAIVDGKKQVWNQVEQYQSKFDSKHPILGTWNLDMETDITGLIFDAEEYVNDTQKYPKYEQYNTGEGGLFFPQIYIRSEDFLGTTDFSFSNNYDKSFTNRLALSQDKNGKPTSMVISKYKGKEIESSQVWYVLAFSKTEMTIVSTADLNTIQFYKKS